MQTLQQAGTWEMAHRRNEILDLIRTEGKVEVEFAVSLKEEVGQDRLHRIITIRAESERKAKMEAKIRLAFLYPGFKVTRLVPRGMRYIL